MQTLRKNVVALSIVGVLAVIGVLISSHQTHAQGRGGGPTVTIDPAQLPLPVTGNSTVSGTVSATQSGPWNVGISGNSVANPLQIRDVDRPGNQPAMGGDQCIASGSRCNFDSLYTVPAGKRLVVEYASASGLLPAGQHFSCFFFPHEGTNFGQIALSLPSSPASTSSGTVVPEAVTAQAMRFYADQSTTLDAGCSRDSDSGAAVFDLHFSGYLVNVP
jgi:hypothetical protein